MKDFTGSLKKNDRKTQETHSDYRGAAMVEGKEYWINGWVKTGEDGKLWLALRFAGREASPPRRTGPARRSSTLPDVGDDIPF